MPDDDMSARAPQPPLVERPVMPPLGMAQIVPTTVIVNVLPGDAPKEGEPAPLYVIARIESMNGSFTFGWSPAEARNMAALLMQQAGAAEATMKRNAGGSGLIVPSLDPKVIDRLQRGQRADGK